MLARYLEDSVLPNLRSGSRLLLIAPDWGLESWLRSHADLRITTMDLAAPRVDVHADLTAMPFEAASFDVVLCSHVLEHVPEDTAAIAELHRVVVGGGVALIQVPFNRDATETDEDPSVTDPAERARRWGQFDHVRRYGRDLLDRLIEPGFEVEEFHLLERIGGDEASRLGLWDDIIFVCRRNG